MSVNRKRAVFTEVENGNSQPPRATVPLPPDWEDATNDVRPEKVAKARQLIRKTAYPPQKVVRSLADQIARFF
jgi:hypothetical protein